MTTKPRDKRFLGFTLKSSQNLGGVWMNEEKPGDPFVCISHRGTWTVTVGLNGHKFEGKGPTDRKARTNFNAQLVGLRQTISLIEGRSKR